MNFFINIYLAVEDDLSEAILRRILRERPHRYNVQPVLKQGGFGYLKKNCKAFNKLASKNTPVLMLTDLDKQVCASELIRQWLPEPRNENFIFRVAVREVEAWLLADVASLGNYMAVRSRKPFPSPENLDDPKNELLKFALKSAKRIIRESITLYNQNGRLYQGPDYNPSLAEYVNSTWPLAKAAQKCPSLKKLLKALETLEISMKGK